VSLWLLLIEIIMMIKGGLACGSFDVDATVEMGLPLQTHNLIPQRDP
jgi:hypothetical protein